MLWIALHLPFLSLESFAATLVGGVGGVDADPQIALVDEHRISAANAAAQAQGVKPGLKRATALALAPRITLGQADPARDAEALLPVAHAALAFTPQVVLQPANEPGAAPHTVLLEVQASLRYFGGLDALLQRLQQALVPLGHLCTPPARRRRKARRSCPVEPPPQCTRPRRDPSRPPGGACLAARPGARALGGLAGMGLRSLDDLLNLPRRGWRGASAKACWSSSTAPSAAGPTRASPSCCRRRSRAGSSCSPAPTPPSRCCTAAVLLERLIAWLAAQHAFVRRFRLLMHHEARWQSDRTPQATR